MLYMECLLSLIAISLTYSADIGPGNTIIEDYQIQEQGKKVDVKLFYECLCHACVEFHTIFLNKTVAKLGAYIDVKTYPYGNSQRKEVNGKTEIECQHGPLECYGNKLHACAIDILKNSTLSVFYNSCMMTADGRSTDEDATRCGQLMGIDAESIIACAKTQKGEDLVVYNGKETEKYCPDKAGVPWPLMNGAVYLGEPKDFLRTVCDYMQHPPPVCDES